MGEEFPDSCRGALYMCAGACVCVCVCMCVCMCQVGCHFIPYTCMLFGGGWVVGTFVPGNSHNEVSSPLMSLKRPCQSIANPIANCIASLGGNHIRG